jgi:molybdenum cofactor biosynthesis enzyme MoaA
MAKEYYKGYYLITSRCNLSCSYCILENSPAQLSKELSLEDKKRLIHHLYHKLNFRSLTISGGEAMIIGKKAPSDFLELVDYLRQFKSKKKEENLKLSVYTNASKLDGEVAEHMKGVIDSVAITLDSTNESTLRTIGRTKGSSDYLDKVIKALQDLRVVGIPVRLHTVVSQLNIEELPVEVDKMLGAVMSHDIELAGWKFFQYMSYDVLETDLKHRVSTKHYYEVVEQIKPKLIKHKIPAHFKDVEEMNNSIFNILPTGIAQYRSGGSWATTKRSIAIIECERIENVFGDNRTEYEIFRKAHSMKV